jgi:uncharacterized phage-like protein YoqJ
MIVCFTGHRPDKLMGYKIPNPMYNWIKNQLTNTLKKIKPTSAISGMALGVDTWAVEVCIDLNIPYVSAIPFKGQENYWPEHSRKYYNELLMKASKIHIVNTGGFAGWKMQNRNEWMVDNSDLLIAVFNGSDGGTKNCYDYAVKKNKEIIRINPLDYKNV